MTTLLQDVRYGLRTLFRSPGFTGVAVLTLALGIGANSTIFTVVKGVLLEPLPYPDAGRLVYVWETNRAVNKDRDPVAPLNYLDWQAETSVFESLAGYMNDGFALLGVDDPEQVGTLAVTSSLFRVLGVEAAIGRTFTEEEERRRDRVVVLSHEFWQRRFKGDRTLIGKSLNLDGNSYTVVGVMGSGFRFSGWHQPRSRDILADSLRAEPAAPAKLTHSQGRRPAKGRRHHGIGIRSHERCGPANRGRKRRKQS
jgi:putative ABC transport system permease protein